MTHNEAPVSVTFKTGTAQYAPQITVRGQSVQEVLNQLVEFQPELGNVGDDLSAADMVAAFGASVVASWAAASKTLEGVVPTPGNPNGNKPAASGGGAAPAADDGSVRVEDDKWGGRYTHNHPKAPPVPTGGKAVLREWKAQSGKAMARWVDPRDPKIPSVYAVNGKDAPADLWDGDWAKV